VLNEKGLVYLFDGRRVLTDRGTDVVQTHRATLELLDNRLEDAGIHVIQAELVDIDHPE